MHLNIAFLETYGLLEAFLYKHSLVRRRNARSSGDEEGSAEHQTRVRSCGCAVIFLHQRNEWHNEATPLNVREPSVALPAGLCRRQKGETREEGGHALRGVRTQLVKKSTPNGVLCFLFKTPLTPKLSRCRCRLCRLSLWLCRSVSGLGLVSWIH